MNPDQVKLSDYHYDLPEDRIAKYPLEKRSDSKLLVFNPHIKHSRFYHLPDFLPSNSTLVFNNTKVIPARIYMQKDTGSSIEVFLTEPIEPYTDFAKASISSSPVTWKCIIGNKKKWKEGQEIFTQRGGLAVNATWIDREKDLVQLKWANGTFQEMIEKVGDMPLPPYMKRKAESADKNTYQTVYGKHEGAVAAPTAGLHFTGEILENLRKAHTLTEVTLHVSAGTFKPVSAENVMEHDMHQEFMQVKKSAIEELLRSEFLVLTGTTTLRTLESLYWYGVKLISGTTTFAIEKLYPYQNHFSLPSRQEALNAILDYMDISGLEELTGTTEIFIFPGYDFKMTDALITNFHLPGSTLILLIASLLGEQWKEVYREALENEYRFLSYGDSSLLFRL